MTRWKTQQVGARRIQAGLPLRYVRPQYERMHGLLMRGVITATYEVDNPQHPILTLDPNITPVAVYCDVLCYSSMINQRFQMLKQVLVSQDVGGMHRGKVWKPRASKTDITGSAIDLDKATNPAFLDGDHVLVGFIDDSPNTPIILKGIPHPSADVGNERKDAGQRLNLKRVDGDPDFWKHHGSYFGINDDGDFVADTRLANNGTVNGEGKEPDAPTDGKGSHRYVLPKDAEHRIELVETDGTTVVLTILIKDGKIELGAEGADDKASLDSLVQQELSRIKDDLDAMKSSYDAHVHPVSTVVSNATPAGPGPVTGAGTAAAPTPMTAPTSPGSTNSDLVTIDS